MKSKVEQWFKEVLCSKVHNPEPKEVVILAPYGMGDRVAVVPYRKK